MWYQIVGIPVLTNSKPKRTRRKASSVDESSRADQPAVATYLDQLNEWRAKWRSEMDHNVLIGGMVQSCINNDLHPALLDILDTAIDVMQADFGNIQLVSHAAGTLKIVVQRGFSAEFLAYFDQVSDGEAACGTAMKNRQRLVVEDIACNPVFHNPRTIEILLASGVRAVQSTPLNGRSGRLVGMLSTHYRTPHLPSMQQLRMLDFIARVAGDFIEWRTKDGRLDRWTIKRGVST